MDILKLQAEEVRAMDKPKRVETESDIRREINNLRLDVYGNGSANSVKLKRLRRSLARIKTVNNEEAIAAKKNPKERSN